MQNYLQCAPRQWTITPTAFKTLLLLGEDGIDFLKKNKINNLYFDEDSFNYYVFFNKNNRVVHYLRDNNIMILIKNIGSCPSIFHYMDTAFPDNFACIVNDAIEYLYLRRDLAKEDIYYLSDEE